MEIAYAKLHHTLDNLSHTTRQTPMGSRANVVVVDDNPDRHPKEAVFLYGHWSGSDLPKTLRAALQSPAGKGRKNDPSYLARIIFNRMTKGDEDGEIGFGISTRLTDNQYPLLVVDVQRGVVGEFPEEEYEANGFAALPTMPGVPFDQYDGRWKR
jgi:hypothetical protein